jgi:iron complex transport system substrate-binding protein
MRIVSLLPSATEIICELGLAKQLVGVTHECDYPEFVKGLPKVTRTLIPSDVPSKEIDRLVRERLGSERALYSLDMPTLQSLAPDLIVTQALCDVCAVAESEVAAAACVLPGRPRVLNLEPSSVNDVLGCIIAVGEAAGVQDAAARVVESLQARVDAVAARTATLEHRPKGVLLEWIDPPFCAGHWSPELVRLAGGIDVAGLEGKPSRTTEWERIRAADPHWIMVACCGFDVARTLADMPLLEAYPGYRDLTCVRNGNVFVTDGSAYFSRPGPRLVDSLEILAHALHPAVHPLPAGRVAALRWPR